MEAALRPEGGRLPFAYYRGTEAATKGEQFPAVSVEGLDDGQATSAPSESVSQSGAASLHALFHGRQRVSTWSKIVNEMGGENNFFQSLPSEESPSFQETERIVGGQQAYEQARADGRTKLNYRQWVQVRTPEFKAWFGDWENDPANASKVIDSETGEPMVVYHGTGEKFTTFNKKKLGSRENKFFFTSDYNSAMQYGSKIIPVFLSSPNMLVFTEENFDAKKAQESDYAIDINEPWNEYAVSEPNQIKSATGNTGAFTRRPIPWRTGSKI
jgi:hypothetical protein